MIDDLRDGLNTVAPPAALDRTPSMDNEIDPQLELRLRILACDLIQRAGRALSIPQFSVGTAQVLLHRFYFAASLKKFGIRDMVLGALFLATKLEETPRRMRDIINVVHHAVLLQQGHPDPPMLDVHGMEYADLERAMMRAEMYLLKYLAFHVHVAHPHMWLVNYLQAMHLVRPPLAQTAWNYINDSYRLPLLCMVQPHVVACAAIQLAADDHTVGLPDRWAALLDVRPADLEYVTAQIRGMATIPPLRWDLPVTADALARDWMGPAVAHRLSYEGWKESLTTRGQIAVVTPAPPPPPPEPAAATLAPAPTTTTSTTDSALQAAIQLAAQRAQALKARAAVGGATQSPAGSRDPARDGERSRDRDRDRDRDRPRDRDRDRNRESRPDSRMSDRSDRDRHRDRHRDRDRNRERDRDRRRY
ncbi:Cyclin-L1 [Allomyces arbusculus]|nr:Cyclin-L1 [Allomyces arbusculus]